MINRNIIKLLAISLAGIVVFVVSLKIIMAVDSTKAQLEAREYFNWSIGVDYYKYNLVTSSSIEFGDALIDSNVVIDAVMQFKVFDIKDDIIMAGLSLSPVSVINAGEHDTTLEKVYSYPVLAHLGRDGRFERLIYPSGITSKEKLMLKGLYKSLEMIIEPEVTYELVQEDSTGEYVADYELLGENLAKSKREYIRLYSNMGSLVSMIAIADSNYIGKPSELSWVESIYGSESISYLDDEGEPVFSADILLNLKRLKSKQYNSNDPFAGKSFEQSARELKIVHRIVNKSLGSSKANKFPKQNEALENLLKGLGDRHSREISLQVREYLLSNRSEISAVSDMILDDDLQDTQKRELINILGIISVPEAQNALTKIASSIENTTENRLRAIISFTSVTEPLTSEALDYLIAQLDNIVKNDPYLELSSAAILAIGSISKNLVETNPEQAAELAETLIQRLDTADNYQKKYLLKSLGNTASEEYSDDITQYIDSADRELRRASVEALRFMNDEHSESILSEMLPVEIDEDVMEAVVKTLSKRELSRETVGVIREVAPLQKRTDTRRVIIGIMGDTIKDNPENRETLTRMLANETSRVNMKRILKAAGNSSQ